MPSASLENGAAARLHCPSAQPDWKGSFAFGVVEGTPREPRVTYLDRRLPITQELIQLTQPVRPTEVLRFAAPCARGACQHWGGGACRLAQKVVARLDAVTDEVPACAVRDVCRWFGQEGAAACFRCPRIVTNEYSADPVMREVTDPAL
jgi:hypothetical protein